MKAAVYEGEGRVSVRDLPLPALLEAQVRVRIESDTICGTDLRIASGAKSKGVTPPVVLGHEVAGTVVEVGDAVTGYRIGDRVGMSPELACGHCYACQRGFFNLCRNAHVLGHDLDGGLTDFLTVGAAAVAAGNLVVTDPRVPFEHISLAEPLSCVLHAQRMLAIDPDDTVLVIGGGAIGLLHAQLARVFGARQVIVSEPVGLRREIASRLGADHVVDPTEEDLLALVRSVTGQAGADVTVVCIGVPALVDQALEATRPRGRVSLFAGFPSSSAAAIDPNRIHYGELIVTGSSNSTVQEYAAAVRLIEQGRVDVGSLVTHRFPLEEISQALKAAASPDAIKVAVLPHG